MYVNEWKELASHVVSTACVIKYRVSAYEITKCTQKSHVSK